MPDQSQMAASFQAAAGFSASDLVLLITGLIGGLAFVWACILVLGWLGMARHQHDPMEFLFMRLTMLAFFMVLLLVLLGS